VHGRERVGGRFRPGLAGGGAVEEYDVPGPTPCTRCGAPLPETDGPRVCALCGQFHDASATGPRPTFGAGAVPPLDDQLRLLTVGPPGPRFEVRELDADTGEGEIAGVAPVRTDSPTSVSARIETVPDGLALVDADGILQVIDLATGEVGAAWGR